MTASTPLTICIAAAAALLATACGKGPPSVAAPGSAVESQADAARVPSPVADPSVPAASAVLQAPAGATRTAAPGVRSNDAMSAAQESSAMPMAGHANDHSAPQAPAKPASAR